MCSWHRQAEVGVGPSHVRGLKLGCVLAAEQGQMENPGQRPELCGLMWFGFAAGLLQLQPVVPVGTAASAPQTLMCIGVSWDSW